MTRVAIKEGDAVAKGDLLIEIDPRPYQLALDAAQARAKVAEAKLKAARIAGANAEHLREKSVISGQLRDCDVQRLTTLCPRLGRVKLAQVLARAGLPWAALALSTCQRSAYSGDDYDEFQFQSTAHVVVVSQFLLAQNSLDQHTPL